MSAEGGFFMYARHTLREQPGGGPIFKESDPENTLKDGNGVMSRVVVG